MPFDTRSCWHYSEFEGIVQGNHEASRSYQMKGSVWQCDLMLLFSDPLLRLKDTYMLGRMWEEEQPAETFYDSSLGEALWARLTRGGSHNIEGHVPRGLNPVDASL